MCMCMGLEWSYLHKQSSNQYVYGMVSLSPTQNPPTQGGRHNPCGRACSAVSPSSGARVLWTTGTLTKEPTSSARVAAEPRSTRLRRNAADTSHSESFRSVLHSQSPCRVFVKVFRVILSDE